MLEPCLVLKEMRNLKPNAKCNKWSGETPPPNPANPASPERKSPRDFLHLKGNSKRNLMQIQSKNRPDSSPSRQLNLVALFMWFWIQSHEGYRIKMLWNLPQILRKATEVRCVCQGRPCLEAWRGHCMKLNCKGDAWVVLVMLEIWEPWDTCQES